MHARGLARRALLRLLQCSLAFTGSFVLGWLFVGSSFFVPLVVVLVPVCLVAGLGARRFNVEYLKASTGVRAEDRVARVLARCRFSALVNGALLGRGDVDHVVLGPQLVAVETKHGRGPVTFDRDGSLRVAGRRLPRDPVSQARANAARLSERLGRRADALVVVVDSTSPPQKQGDVWVCSLRDLPSVVQAFPARIDASSAEGFARSLPVAG